MASNYPGSLDSFDTIASDKKTSDSVGGRTHRDMHNDLGDAIESVQTELGTNPSGSDATVAARLSAIEAGTNLATGAVTSAKIADGTIVNDDINASAAIARSKISGLPTSSTDNTVARFDSTAGAIQTSGVVIDDNNRLTVATGATGGYGFASGAVHLSGTGTPEGVVTAAPGSTWLQIGDAVTVSGNLLWRKISGTGNTGWEPEGALADTGWRDVASLLGAGLAASSEQGIAALRRVGKEVYYQCKADVSSATASLFVTLPTGFKVTGTTSRRQFPLYTATSAGTAVPLTTAGNVAYTSADAMATYNYLPNPGTALVDASWTTTDAWPSSLPGSAI